MGNSGQQRLCYEKTDVFVSKGKTDKPQTTNRLFDQMKRLLPPQKNTDTKETKNETGKSGICVIAKLTDKSLPEGGVSINFLKTDGEESPEDNWPKNLLFHFNPRPNDKIILNTYTNDEWQKELILQGRQKELEKDSFTLTIEVLNSTGNEFMVILNDQSLTTFKSEADITKTNCIVFSPQISIIQICDLSEIKKEKEKKKKDEELFWKG